MSGTIKILQKEIESLKFRVDQGASIYPLVEEYKKQITSLELAIYNLKMLEAKSNCQI